MAVVEHEVNRHETLVEDTESKRKGGTTLHTSPNMIALYGCIINGEGLACTRKLNTVLYST